MERLIKSTRRPDITFNRDGRIQITAAIAAALDLQPGDCINIYADNGEYYMFAIHSERNERCHARVYPTKRGSRNFRAISVRLVCSLLDACGITARRAAFAAGEPVRVFGRTYIPIITKHPLNDD